MQRPDVGPGQQPDLLLEAQLCQPAGDVCFMINCCGLGHACLSFQSSVAAVTVRAWRQLIPGIPSCGTRRLNATGYSILVGDFPHPLGGAAWLDERGQTDMLQARCYTWITARMLHVYAIGSSHGATGRC